MQNRRARRVHQQRPANDVGSANAELDALNVPVGVRRAGDALALRASRARGAAKRGARSFTASVGTTSTSARLFTELIRDDVEVVPTMV